MVPRKSAHTFGFKHALEGLRFALHTQNNLIFHILVATGVAILGFVLEINVVEWLFLIVAIVMVLTVELINTAVELWVDSGILEANIYARRAKDIAAAAVVVAVFGAVSIGAIIFIPHLIFL